MKFQHLILPLLLWMAVCGCIWYFVPTSPLIIGLVVVLISLATYFSLRLYSQLYSHKRLPLIGSCCIALFLLSSVLSGFSIISLLLIAAMGTLVSLLTTETKGL